MKKLAGLVIILAVLVLGGYFLMGLQTEKTIKKNIEVINQNNGLFAELKEYKRGWFYSNAQIKWNLHVPERMVKDANGNSQLIAAQDYQMDMPVKIYHGPLIIAGNSVKLGMGYATSSLPIPENYTQKFDEMFTKDSVKPVLQISIFVNYLNKSTLNLNLPSFKLIAKDGKTQMDWKGMSSNTSISSGVERVDGAFTVEGVDINKDEAKINLNDARSDYDLHKTSTGLYLGNAKFSLATFSVADKSKKIFELNDLSASSDSGIDDNLFYTHFNMSVKSIIAHDKTYGPGTLEVTLRNLDADVLAKINEQASTMKNGSDAEHQQAMLAILPELPKLLNKGAEFEVTQLSVKLPQGNIKGSLLFSMPKGNSDNPFEILQKIKGHAQLKVPADVVKLLTQKSIMQQMARNPEMQQSLTQQLQTTPASQNQPQAALTPEQLASMQADKQIAGLVQAGLIVAQDKDYFVEINLEQGKFSVNGKPYDPAALKF